MNYLALARKWRPKSFADTVGQQHVLQALMNALESGRLHHAYLFAGTRGVGKTTIARILAKALNCDKGVSAEPCGECSACTEIDEGRFVDLIEVDAASKTKVDDTRELLDNVQYSPARGRFKVYLIDEVHMLSKSSFNALLKTLEEPPPHVKFLLATTDPQKLPVTVLSRCLQFNLSRLTPRQIADRLAYICEQEKLSADGGSLNLLARAADGSLRDALSLLDQAIAYCGGTLDETQVAKMLGTIDRDYVTRLLRLLAGNDGAGVIQAIAEIDEHFPDYSRLLEELARDLQRIAIHQVIGHAASDENLDADELSELADALPPADVQLFYQTALLGRRDLQLAPDPRSGAEMTLLRMLAFRPAGASRADGGGSASRSAPKVAAVPKAAGKKSARKKVGSQKVEATERRKTEDRKTEGGKTEHRKIKWQDPDWASLVPNLGLKGAVRMLALNCVYLRREQSTVYFSADSKAESVLTKDRQKLLAKALSGHYGETLTVSIEIDDAIAAEQETPVQQESRESEARREAAKVSLESDPNVQALKNLFGAELKTDTIEPINPSHQD